MRGFNDRDFRLSHNFDRLSDGLRDRLSDNFSDLPDPRLHQKSTFFRLFNGLARAFREVRQ